MESTLRISSGAISDRGLSDKRPENEDAYLELGHFGIYAVADGVGGAQAGDVASQMAMEILGEAFMNLRPGFDPESVMLAAIEKANCSIHQMARDLPQLSSMATTVVALHLNGNIATIGHVGDSRLYRVDREGNFYRETDDHSMVAEEVRAGRMTEEQAENHPSRNIISRALGADETVSVDLKTLMIDGGTAFLLCSDGITRHVTDQEIKGVLTFGGSPVDICEYLKDLCYYRGAEDNLTAVVVKTSSTNGDRANIGNSSDLLTAKKELDVEESTVATARPQLAVNEVSESGEEDLLELETVNRQVPRLPAEAEVVLDPRPSLAKPVENTVDPGYLEQPESVFRIEPPYSTPSEKRSDLQSSELSTFGRSGTSAGKPKRTNTSAVLSAFAFLALGAVVGIGAYYFALAPEPVDTDGPRLTEMRAANIPLSAFEENRRNVDKDPATYIARFGTDPQDSEDFYLLGRAYLLTGDYTNARTYLNMARNKLPEADPTNLRVLASDIAIAISVINDTTVQSILRKELEAAPPASTQQENTNSN